MANVDNPHGLMPLMRCLGGGEPTIRWFDKAATYGTALFVWDAVYQVADGTIDKSGTPGTTLLSGVNLVHGAASKLTEHAVIVSPDAVFDIQDNNDTDGVAAADLGASANIELNAGSATTLISGHELDESTIAAASKDIKILGLIQKEGNAYGSWADVEVCFNLHRMGMAAAAV